MRGVVRWISKTYKKIPILITENGLADSPNVGVNDTSRKNFLTVGRLKKKKYKSYLLVFFSII